MRRDATAVKRRARTPRRSVAAAIALLGWFVSAVAGAVVTPVSAGWAEALARSSIAGEWIRAAPERDDARRHEAIEDLTEEMSFLIRGFAAGFMRRATRPPERYTLRRVGGAVEIRRDDEAPKTARLSGDADPDPDSEVTSRPIEGGFVQGWRHDESSHGTTTWRVTEDEDGAPILRVTVTAHDERFPHPLVYTTTYRRLRAEPRTTAGDGASAVGREPRDGSSPQTHAQPDPKLSSNTAPRSPVAHTAPSPSPKN